MIGGCVVVYVYLIFGVDEGIVDFGFFGLFVIDVDIVICVVIG